MRKLSQKMVRAVCDKDIKAVASLLDARQNVNAKNENGETAFSYACAMNALAVAKLLHSRGADVNTIDKGNGSPLDWAASRASKGFCAWLIGVGGRHHDIWPPRGKTGRNSGRAPDPSKTPEPFDPPE